MNLKNDSNGNIITLNGGALATPAIATQSKSVTLGSSTPSTVTPDSEYDGLSQVGFTLDTSVIKAENIAQGSTILGIAGSHSGGITPSGSKSITTNGTHDVTNYASAVVNVQPSLQTKSVTLGSAAPATVTPDSSYDGLSSVSFSLDSTTITSENIAEGCTILGVEGTHSGGSSTQKKYVHRRRHRYSNW